MTEKDLEMQELRQELKRYKDTGLEPEDVIDMIASLGTAIGQLTDYRMLGSVDHLRELVQAEKEGRLVVLPCNLKHPLYIVKDGKVTRNYGVQWHFTDRECQTFGTLSVYGGFVNLNDFGITVFLTRKEAETALSAQNGEESLEGGNDSGDL